MSKILKAGILLVTLAIPALLFIFLHGFGENRFNVPVYYENGVDSTFADCSWSHPFRVSEFNKRVILNRHISLIGFAENISYDPDYLNRITVDFENFPNVQTVLIAKSDSLEVLSKTELAGLSNKKLLLSYATNFDELLACSFVINRLKVNTLPLVLIDGDRRIRGYYQLPDDEEFDRLIAELNILIENKE